MFYPWRHTVRYLAHQPIHQFEWKAGWSQLDCVCCQVRILSLEPVGWRFFLLMRRWEVYRERGDSMERANRGVVRS